MLESDIAKTYCIIPILERLLDVKSVENYCKERGLDFSDEAAKGYAFSVVCTINHLVTRVLVAPGTMNLKYEKVLGRADFVGLPFSELPDQTDTGKFARNLVELCRQFLGINNWSDFRKAGRDVSEYIVTPFKTAFSSGMKETVDSKGNNFIESTLKYAAIWYIDFILLSYQDIRSTYSNAYKREPIRMIPDSVPLFIGKSRFFYGYKLAILYLIESIIGSNYNKSKGLSKIKQCEDWDSFDKLFAKIEIHKVVPKILDFEKSHYLDSTFKTNKIGNSLTLLQNLRFYSGRQKSVEQKLDELFMWYGVSMLDVANNALGFVINLRGYSSFKVKKIYVVKIAHPQEINQNKYSFAILIESRGLLSDYSYWLLFYNFATDYSGNGSVVLNEILKELCKRGKQIELQEAVVSEDDVEKYLESHRVKRLTTENQKLRELNKAMKGWVFEQFVANLLSKMGFTTYISYRNSSFLGNKEIDVIAIKEIRGKLKIIIAETFGSFPVNGQYAKEIAEEMEEKLSIVKNNYLTIVSQITRKKDIKSLSSVQLWIVTHDSTKRKKISSNILIYDFDRLKKLCNELNVNYYPLAKILKKQKETVW